MLIIQITQSFFSHGAVMRRARQETKALLNAGHRVIIITDLRWTSQILYFKELQNKPEIISLKPFYIHRPLRRVSSELSFTLLVYFVLKELSKKEKIDLIITHQSTACYAVARFSKKNKIPSAWVIQDLISDRIVTGNPYNWLETQMFKHAHPYGLKNMHYIIPVSNYTKKLALIGGAKPEKTFIKYNTVDTETFHPDKEKTKDIDILFVGRLSIEKGIDILIEATKYLLKKRIILIIGDGPLANNLKRQAQQVQRDIRFQGFIDHELLPQFIQRAKLVVAPSRSECHAAVPLEAMACGVPVIASCVGGMEDTIEHDKNGWLLEQNNAKTLGRVIENILSDNMKLKIISKAALKRADFFSEKKFNRDIVKFYEILIKKY